MLDDYFAELYNYLKSNEQQELLHYLNKFDINKFDLFLRVMEYELATQKDLKKINVLREAKRIDSGLINTKLINKIYQGVCEDTYGGFLRALKQKSIFFVEAEINGKTKIFLAKTNIGKSYLDSKFGKLKGWHNLLLDPVTLDVYQYNRRTRGKVVLEPYHKSLSPVNAGTSSIIKMDPKLIKQIKKEIKGYVVNLKQNYINYYSDPSITKKEKVRELAKKRINEIFSKKNVKKKLGIDVSHSHASHKLK